jgi:hypothetical protein
VTSRGIYRALFKGGNLYPEYRAAAHLPEDFNPIIEKSGLKVGKDIFLCHCPERILPGAVLKEIVETNGYTETQKRRKWL